MTKQFVLYCEIYFKLYLRQIDTQKKSAINIIFILIHTIQEIWKKKS